MNEDEKIYSQQELLKKIMAHNVTNALVLGLYFDFKDEDIKKYKEHFEEKFPSILDLVEQDEVYEEILSLVDKGVEL